MTCVKSPNHLRFLWRNYARFLTQVRVSCRELIKDIEWTD